MSPGREAEILCHIARELGAETMFSLSLRDMFLKKETSGGEDRDTCLLG